MDRTSVRPPIPRLVMITIGLMILASSCLVAAQQQGSSCQCYAYFVCQNRTWDTSVECPYHNEVCCELDPIDVTTAKPVVPSSTPGSRTSGEGICGGRKKQKKGSVDWKLQIPLGIDGNTTFGEFPWMVAILRNTPTGQKFLCGGSIIYPNIILTAAHTVSGIPASDLLMKAGVWNTIDPSEVSKHQDKKVNQVLIHPGYDEDKVANDVALLVLNEPLIITDNVAPVCLPSSFRNINESACIATGWGADRFGNQNGNILKKVTLPLVNFDTCQTSLRGSKLGPDFNLHNSFLCAGGGSEGDTCLGDGGGPLMCSTVDDPEVFVQIGITSWGVGCSQGVPGAYASVQVAADWIEDQSYLYPPIFTKTNMKHVLWKNQD